MDTDWMDEDTYKEWASSARYGERWETRTHHGCSYYCLTFIMTILIVLIIVFIAGTGAFYWYIFEYRDATSSITTYVEIPISISIDEEYMAAYDDTTSQEYKNFTTSYIDEMDKEFFNTSLEDMYFNTYVVLLRPGSVLVNSSSIFENKPAINGTLTLQERLENLRQVIERILTTALSDGFLGDYLSLVPNSSLLIGSPMLIEELPVVTETTTKPPTSTAKVTHKSESASTTTVLVFSDTTLAPTPSECQSPDEITLVANTDYDLVSTNYPSHYPPDTNCQWTIRAPSGQRIRASFAQLSIEDDVDFLYVGTGSGADAFDTLTYTGTRTPLDIISLADTLVLTFQSSSSVGAQGFSVRFRAIQPPGENMMTCDNNLEVLVADNICNVRVECNDGSDETDCHDPLETGICGSTIPTTRILGGRESALGSMPWMGSVRTASGGHYCGATLLSDQWAITAAHCIIHADHMVFGGTSLDNPSDYEETVPISVIYAHPGYNMTSKHPDVALIRLARPVKISPAIRQACLAHIVESVEEVDVYTDCRAVGWGTSDDLGGMSPVLKEVDMPLLPRAECSEMTSSSDASRDQLCAGNAPNSDTCTGDNGGPLLCRGDNNLWHLVGITTRSSPCMSADIDVYTRISALRNFILTTVTQTEACIGTPLESSCLEGCVGGDDCRTQCTEDQVRCQVGNCIANSKTCDEVADCIDATDEGSAQSCTSEGCGGQISTAPNFNPATIQSPGYPSPYQSLQRCQWTVTTTAGNRVRIHFNDFNTENIYDVLHIGDSSFQTFLRLSGDYVPLDALSLDETVTLTFESDYALEMGGFALQATSINDNEIGTLNTCSNGMQIVPDPQTRNIRCNGISECSDHSDEIPCACGNPIRPLPLNGIIQIQSQNFDNGGYPGDPVPCQWFVTAWSPDTRLQVTFTDFKTESGYDFLTIATGMEDSATTVSYSGHNIPPDVVSTGSQLVIRFTADASGGAAGFKLQVADISSQMAAGLQKCTNNIEVLRPEHVCDGINHCADGSDEETPLCKCGDSSLFLVPSGSSLEFSSPRYPSNYQNTATCVFYAILDDSSQKLRVHFNDFILEDGKDYLKIGNMNFTGSALPSDVISPNSEFRIEFITDYSITSTGFSITLSGEE